MPGQIVILNGAPRSGKSSIVAAIQRTFDGPWMNLGVDVFVREVTPPRYRPGMGLRPGEPDHPAAPLVPSFYAALYDSIAAHSRAGLNVVVDVGHYDGAILADSARRLAGLPVLFVGVRCPIDVIMARRNAGQPGREHDYATGSASEPVPARSSAGRTRSTLPACTTSRLTRRRRAPTSARWPSAAGSKPEHLARLSRGWQTRGRAPRRTRHRP